MTEVLQSLQVLIVEDTLTQAMMIQHVLGKVGIKSTIAKSGAKALTILSEPEKHPDLILSDVNMPEMSGYELCRTIKQNPALAAIPFILLSTPVASEDLIHTIECGADNFICKSFDGDYFTERLQAIVEALSKRSNNSSENLVSAVFSADGEEKTLSLSGQRLADFLMSSFEAVVSQTRGGKS